MNRRGFLGSAASAALAATAQPAATPMRLFLRHTWTTTMSSSEYRDTILFQLNHAGIEALGEGAPIARYHESAE
ncbi:MAG TPA: dipeptide epimerase, partial [Bryobacteraceae bacterium]|nr:dipeptide epimerase [Bryobacteraceae bacterium]